MVSTLMMMMIWLQVHFEVNQAATRNPATPMERSRRSHPDRNYPDIGCVVLMLCMSLCCVLGDSWQQWILYLLNPVCTDLVLDDGHIGVER